MTTWDFSQFIHLLRRSFTAAARRPLRMRRGVELERLEERWVPAAVIVRADPHLFTTESSGTAQFTVVLSEKPTRAVTIPISSSNSKEGTASIKKVVFTPQNWDQPQTVTVKGIDDKVTDGDKPFSIVLKPATGDKLYARQNPDDVAFVNKDNDVPKIPVTAGSTLQTSEQGGTATFKVQLATKPTADVLIPFHSSNVAEGTVTPSLKFTAKNWDKPQTVKITGIDDPAADGNQPYQILFDASQSADSHYAGLTAAALSVTNLDNEAGAAVDHSLDGIYTGEAAGTVTILGSKTSQTLPVEFSVSGDDVTVTKPGDFTGKITSRTGTFKVEEGPLKGASFTGGFIENSAGTVTFAGTWKISQLGVSGSGTILATRPAPVA